MIRRISILLVLAASLSFSQEEAIQFERANQLYRDGKYRDAAAMYEQIYKNGFEGPSLHYNMGNAYFKLNNVPRSIISYERARRLSPQDEDILYNLRMANLRVVDKIEPLPKLFFMEWWDSLIDHLSSAEWALSIIITVWVAAFSVAGIFLLKNPLLQRAFLIISLLSLVFTIVSFIGMYQRLSDEMSVNEAVIVSQTVSVKSAPDQKSTDLFVLHEGVKVELLDYVSKWHKIRLPDGKVGWLETGTIGII